ncbi:NRPS-like enzyme [Aspergillus pseudotamarii]|uniref:NRPS-like enzyme n=1 Tax=Aspergillus pseudotamarii TaxID=132259 RepID=A0A5N6SHU7_ASPPS|nr:NRPS-like enzyme [Aspergillus pseudotamarii]KAE8133310.1 NRPS-like enzyme [Aspergillus pseudotamarii]
MTAPEISSFDPRTQLIPNIIDHYAQVKPDAIYAEYPISPMSYEDGYRPITFRALANAINGIAWWLTEKLGPGHGEILAYVGPNDLRYPALVLGAVKAGYCMFLTSPRNSVVAHSSLFKRLNCTTLISPMPRPPAVTTILEACTLNVLDAPSVDELVSKEYSHFDFSKTYPEAAREILAVVHTSGSTGIPKPIFWTHDTACKHMEVVVLEPPVGYESLDHWNRGKRMYLVPPPFHAAGLAYLHFVIPAVGISLILPTSGGLPTAAALVEARKRTPFETALIVPSIVQELAQSPDLLDYCSKNLTHLIYCGGDLPQQIGDTVAAKIKLVNQYGASEVGMVPSIYSKSNRDPLKDWRYIDFHPSMGVELRNIAGEEYEMVIARNPERERYQFPFTLFPDKQEYHTSDLFVRHPDPAKPDLWRWCARVDDVIVFLNGEKTNPVSMEQHIIACNPDVTAALVAGSQRFQASLLLEVNGKNLSVSERAAAIEKIWPSIEQANAVCPAHARVAKTHILFTTPDKPMLRAGKGTIQRAGTLAQYAQELDALYIDADKLAQDDGDRSGPGCTEDPKLISDYIRQSILTITGWNANKLTDTENWFNLGLDSLQTITATRIFKRGLDSPNLTPNLIYLHPTVMELTQAVLHLQQHQEASTEAQNEVQLHDRDQLLQELIGQLATGTAHTESPKAHTVLLTGSTGNLGTYMLDTLLRNPTVGHIHCLNRKDNAIDVQRKKSEAYNLNLDTSRVSFWSADLSQPDFGLQSDILQMLQSTITLVIHNAWAVNFNLSLASFKPNLVGVVNLINFTRNATQSPHLFFISSISSTMGHRTDTGLTPEELITTTTPAPNGYANSKYLAEHLLAQAAKQSSLHASFARVGQIAGPVRSRGLWNKTEWFPSLVLSSLHVGALPDTLGPALGRIDWVPIDLLAEVLVDLALGQNKTANESVNVFHPVNLQPLTWEAIRPFVADALFKTSGKPAEIIPFRDWVQRIRQDIETAGAGGKALSEEELQALVAKNPAVKLLEFFEGIMSNPTRDNVLDTQLTAQRSGKLQAVEAVKPEWIQKWVREWVQ